MPRIDGVIAAIVGIAFGMLATLWVVLVSLTARIRRQDGWPMMRRSMPGIVLFGGTSICLMGASRVLHADPALLDHAAKVFAIVIPIAAIYMTVFVKRR